MSHSGHNIIKTVFTQSEEKEEKSDARKKKALQSLGGQVGV